jgi:hypothetical protein
MRAALLYKCRRCNRLLSTRRPARSKDRHRTQARRSCSPYCWCSSSGSKAAYRGPARRIPYTPHNGDPQITLASMSRAAEPTSGLTAFNNCGWSHAPLGCNALPLAPKLILSLASDRRATTLDLRSLRGGLRKRCVSDGVGFRFASYRT